MVGNNSLKCYIYTLYVTRPTFFTQSLENYEKATAREVGRNGNTARKGKEEERRKRCCETSECEYPLLSCAELRYEVEIPLNRKSKTGLPKFCPCPICKVWIPPASQSFLCWALCISNTNLTNLRVMIGILNNKDDPSRFLWPLAYFPTHIASGQV